MPESRFSRILSILSFVLLIALLPMLFTLVSGENWKARMTRPNTLFKDGFSSRMDRQAAAVTMTVLGPSLTAWLKDSAPSCNCRLSAIQYGYSAKAQDHRVWLGSIVPAQSGAKPQQVLIIEADIALASAFTIYGADEMVNLAVRMSGVSGTPTSAAVMDWVLWRSGIDRPAKFAVLLD